MPFDLAQIPYFAGIDQHGLSRIEQAAHRHTFSAGGTIFIEGSECAGFHVVLEGLVRIYRVNAEGRLHTLSLLRPFSTFNEVAAVDGDLNPFNAVAVTNAEVLNISHERMMNLMATEPVLLLLDEPSAGMNPHETAELGATISRLHRELGLTIILVEHDMKMIMTHCQRIHVMHQGRILAEGSPTEIQRNPRVIEAYLGRRREGAHAVA